MQRWIVLGVLVLGLLGVGSWFGYREYKRSGPSAMWIALPINPELNSEQRKGICEELKVKLSDREILNKVAQDTGVMAEWSLPTEEAAADEILKRLFVRPGSAEGPLGPVPAIEVGVKGKVRERKLLGEISMRLRKDVFRILGIEEPKREGMDPPPI
jgi:hypothetical protein